MAMVMARSGALQRLQTSPHTTADCWPLVSATRLPSFFKTTSHSQAHTSANLFNLPRRKAKVGLVRALFGFGRKSATKIKRETVIPEPDYRIPIVLLGAAGALIYTDNLLPAAPFGFLGLLLLVQTTRVRFVFDDEALEVKLGSTLTESGENVFFGGKNRWKYSTFTNWELWWPNFPVLVYFKETQTKPEGQVHFFPVIFNGKQLYDVMVERAGPSKTSGPKSS